MLALKNWIMVWDGYKFNEVTNFSAPIKEKIYCKNLMIVINTIKNAVILFKE